MNDTWELFFNKKIELLQKNQINNNDLFTNPVDINDNNIPNGNSVFLYICNKLYTITNDKIWLQKTEILKKSFHSLINSNFYMIIMQTTQTYLINLIELFCSIQPIFMKPIK